MRRQATFSSRCSAARYDVNSRTQAGVGSRHGFQERREQIPLLVFVVLPGGEIEVAHHGRGSRSGLIVGAVGKQMGLQPPQRRALLLDAAVTGREHLQRDLESRRWRGVARDHPAHVVRPFNVTHFAMDAPRELRFAARP
jgi:hypothetical protein